MSSKVRMNKAHIYTFVVIIFPILNRYCSFIPRVSIAEILILFAMIMILCIDRFKLNIQQDIFIICSYLLFSIIITTLEGRINADVLWSTLRLVYLYGIIALFGKRYFDGEYAKGLLVKVCLLIGVYGIIQTLFSVFNIFLPTYFHCFQLLTGIDTDSVVLEKAGYGMRFRAQAVFNEPAQMCTYLLLGLAIILSNRKLETKLLISALVISSACILSISSTGIIVTLLIWSIYYVSNLKNGKIPKLLIYGVIIMMIAVGLFFWKFDIYDYFIERTFGTCGQIRGIAQSSRFRGLWVLSNVQSLGDVLFGKGVGDIEAYLPGIARWYYYFGIIGIGVLLLSILGLYKKGDSINRYILFLYLVLNLGTEIMLGNFLVLYLPFVVCNLTLNQKNVDKSLGTV